MNYADNGFKGNSSGGGTPIVPRQHNIGSSMGYVGNGFVQSELHSHGIKTVPVVERDKSKKEVYAGNGFDNNVNHSGTVGGNINPRTNSSGPGYIGNGLGERNF